MSENQVNFFYNKYIEAVSAYFNKDSFVVEKEFIVNPESGADELFFNLKVSGNKKECLQKFLQIEKPTLLISYTIHSL